MAHFRLDIIVILLPGQSHSHKVVIRPLLYIQGVILHTLATYLQHSSSERAASDTIKVSLPTPELLRPLFVASNHKHLTVACIVSRSAYTDDFLIIPDTEQARSSLGTTLLDSPEKHGNNFSISYNTVLIFHHQHQARYAITSGFRL